MKKIMKKYTPRIIFYSLFIGAVLLFLKFTNTVSPISLVMGGNSFEWQWPDTDFSQTTVNLDEIISGGPPKDGIPALDKPVFVSVSQAARWLHPREPVIVVEYHSKARAYPLQILIYHEIVNDTFEDLPLTVTFCPLCNASIVFDRRLEGRTLDFGTTGNLRKSDMVMYDRQTQSWWQQFIGKGIIGHYAGKTLAQIPSKIVAFDAFKTSYPNGNVLSNETGYSRPYGHNPYRGYDRIGDTPFLFSDPIDKRLPAMERVISIGFKDGITNKFRLYPFDALDSAGLIHDQLNDLPIVIFHKENLLSVLDATKIADSRSVYAAVAYDRRIQGRVLQFKIVAAQITDTQTKSVWDIFGRAISGPLKGKQLKSVDSGVHFAFAWLAFNPDSEIYNRGM